MYEALESFLTDDILDSLRSGADDEAIEEYENEVHRAFPEALRRLWAWRDGSADWAPFFRGLELCGVESSRSIKSTMDDLEATEVFDRWMPGDWWNPAWIPIMDNHSYDTLCIDLEGCFDGSPGQLVWWCKDDPSRTLVAPSLTVFVDALILGLEEGHLQVNFDEGGIYEPKFGAFERIVAELADGYPRNAAARTRASQGLSRDTKPPEFVETKTDEIRVEFVGQVWLPGESGATSIAAVDGAGLVAVGQYAHGDGYGLSLVDPVTGAVEEVIEPSSKDGGSSALQVITLGESCLAYSRDAAAGREIIVYDLDSGAKEVVAELSGGRMNEPLSVDRTGRWLLFGSDQIGVHDLVENKTSILGLDVDTSVNAAVHPRGGYVVAHAPDGEVGVYPLDELDEPERVLDGSIDEAISRFFFSEDGQHLYAILHFGTDTIRWDWATGARVETPQPARPFVLAITPESNYLSAAGSSGGVHIWNMATTEEVHFDNAHGVSRVYGLDFDREGNRLYSAGQEGQLVTRELEIVQ